MNCCVVKTARAYSHPCSAIFSSISRASKLPLLDAATSNTRAWSQFLGTPSPRRNRSASATSAGTYPFLTPDQSRLTATCRSRRRLLPRKISSATLNSSCPLPASADVAEGTPDTAPDDVAGKLAFLPLPSGGDCATGFSDGLPEEAAEDQGVEGGVEDGVKDSEFCALPGPGTLFLPPAAPLAGVPPAPFAFGEVTFGFAEPPEFSGTDPVGTSESAGFCSAFCCSEGAGLLSCAGADVAERFSPEIDWPSWIKVLPMSCLKL